MAIWKWFDEHQDLAYDLIRIYLGIALFIRGYLFIADMSLLVELLRAQDLTWLSTTGFAHYIALAHLAGGILLAVGLFTRLAALVQLPILFGAVFIVHLKEGLLAQGQSLELAALVFFLLLVFFFFGAGPLSMDRRILQQKVSTQETVR